MLVFVYSFGFAFVFVFVLVFVFAFDKTSRLARASTRSSPRLCGEMIRQRRWRNADTAIIENGNLPVVVEMVL